MNDGRLGCQIAIRRATERLGALADKYGVDVLVATVAEVLNYSENDAYAFGAASRWKINI